MQDTNSSNEIDTGSNHLAYRRVNAKQGALWLTQAYQLFSISLRSWIGISAFLIFILLLPGINSLVSMLMPVAIGGIMLGCDQLTKESPLKFDHLFEGIKSDAKTLLHLSLVYAICTLIIMVITYYLMLFAGVDIIELSGQFSNKETLQMSEAERIKWLNNLIENGTILYFLLAFLITLALMLPLYMAFWFAPALVVFKKMAAVDALKLSFLACKNNLVPFFIYGLVAFGYFILFLFVLTILAAIMPLIIIPVVLFGSVIVFSITLASIYTSYVDIFDKKNNLNEDSNDKDNFDSSMLA